MTEREEFFSPGHNRLLNIATWAKYLAWVALVVYVLNAVLQMFQYQFSYNNNFQLQQNTWGFLLRDDPLQAFKILVNMATTALRGVVFYLVLKGISLGLNMIVETDINYREQKGGVE